MPVSWVIDSKNTETFLIYFQDDDGHNFAKLDQKVVKLKDSYLSDVLSSINLGGYQPVCAHWEGIPG